MKWFAKETPVIGLQVERTPMAAHVTIEVNGEVIEDLGMLTNQEIIDEARDRTALGADGEPILIDEGAALVIEVHYVPHGPIVSTLHFASDPRQFVADVLALDTVAAKPWPDRIVLML